MNNLPIHTLLRLIKSPFKFFHTVGLSVVLLSCSGGEGIEGTGFDDTFSDDPEYVGIEGTGIEGGNDITVGEITAFGSIYVNGIEIETGDSSIYIDDETGSDADLALGMIVQVRGNLYEQDIPRASSINFESVVKGPVGEIQSDAVPPYFTVFDQKVVVSDVTVFHNITLAEAKAGAFVRVSGYQDDEGNINATRVGKLADRLTDSHNIVVQGRVLSINSQAQTLVLHGHSVDYSLVAKEPLFTDLSVGQRIRLTGTYNSASKIFTATRARQLKDRLSLPQGRKVTWTGQIFKYENIGDFIVNGAQVDASAASFETGDASMLAEGREVWVKGYVNDDHTLIAEQIAVVPLRDEWFIASGKIEDLGPLLRRITINGEHFFVNRYTKFIDKSSRQDRYFYFRDLEIGDDVHLAYVPFGDLEVKTLGFVIRN